MKKVTVLSVYIFLGFIMANGGALYASPQAAQKKPLAGYNVILVERFTVEKNAATEGFPKGQEMLIQSDTVERLQKVKLFEKVIDAAESPAPEAAPPATPEAEAKSEPQPAEGRLILSGTVIMYDKGSRAGRWLVGFGAGATKVKVRFVFRDGQTGAEVFRTDRQGKFYGTVSFVGGGKGQAVSEAAGDVVDGLIKDIRKNR